MDQFWEEFEAGEIHFRDKWQFELKSEFSPDHGQKQSEYAQEFYIFIPSALQINSQTYSKDEFFRAETNLIRLQTPELTFEELLNSNSPLAKLQALQESIEKPATLQSMELELKLFANIFRKTLRNAVRPLLRSLEQSKNNAEIDQCKVKIMDLLSQIERTKKAFLVQQEAVFQRPEGVLLRPIFEYIREVMSISLNSLMASLLEAIRQKSDPLLNHCDHEITALLLEEKKYREERLKEPNQFDKNGVENEAILHQSGLLNKFILDALQLKTRKLAINEKYRSLIGGFAAALAMFLYLLAFIWQGAIFVINSFPFVFFTVVLYVVKDRMKEELKNLSYKHVFRWFPDYTTEISLPSGKTVIGKVHESFSFIDEQQVPLEIQHLRNQGFHSYLEMIKRQEDVIYYKKKVVVYERKDLEPPLRGLSIIFRFNLHHFFNKGSNPYEFYTTIDAETLELIHLQLAKVYHVNIILKNTYLQADMPEKVEYKKVRIVADKEGVKRIESLINL